MQFMIRNIENMAQFLHKYGKQDKRKQRKSFPIASRAEKTI